jgi:hypothetical protein
MPFMPVLVERLVIAGFFRSCVRQNVELAAEKPHRLATTFYDG